MRELRDRHGRRPAVRRRGARARLPRRRRAEATGGRGVGRARRRPRRRRRRLHDVLQRELPHRHDAHGAGLRARGASARVALVCETNGGLTDHVPEADCLVSTGNEDELVDAWTPERVIGGDEAPASASACRRCTTSAASGRPATRAGRRCRHDGRALREPVLRRARRRGGRRARTGAPRRPAGTGARARGRGARASTSRSRAATTTSASTRTTSLATLLGWLDELEPGRARLRSVVRLRTLRLRVRRARPGGRAARGARRRRDDARLAGRDRGRGRCVRRADRARTSPACARPCPSIASLASRLAAGEPVGGPDEEGYLPRGLRVNALVDRTGAERAIDLLLAKLGGDVRTEVAPSRRPAWPPPPPVADLALDAAGARHRGRLRAAGQSRPAADAAFERVASIPDRRRRDDARRRRVRVGARRVRHVGGQRRPEPARAARRRASARARRERSASCTTRSTRRAASTRPSRWPRAFGQEIAAELRRGAGRRGDPDRHLRNRHALRGNAGEGVRARGHPDRVRDGIADDRADGGGEPHRAGRRDHASDGRPVARRRGRTRAARSRSCAARSRCSRPTSSRAPSGS